MFKSSSIRIESGIAASTFPNSAITLAAVTAIPVTSTTSPSAKVNTSKPSYCPAVALTPDQILVSFLVATCAATCATK